jgi:excisionase family DNA binding protein
LTAALAHLAHAGSIYLTQTELAQFLRVSDRTLERWRLEGNGPPHIKAGRRCLYSRSDVENWLLSRRRHSTSETFGGSQ